MIEVLLLELREFKNILPKQIIKTLRGQALSGDVAGAKKGLEKIKRKIEEGDMVYGNSSGKFKKRKKLKKH